MAKCHNCTQMTGFGHFCGSSELWVMLGVISALLVLSVGCFIIKYCTDNGKKFLPRFRRSLSLKLRDMEENPIYGNITYTQARADLPVNSSLANDHKMKGTLKAHSRQRDCYANLKLEAPKPASARGSPQIQYSDVVTRPKEVAETLPEEDTVSLRSDVYASVESERNKTLGNTEDYANHV